MWIETTPNGKFKYTERYKDAFGRSKKVSVTLEKNTSRAQNDAQRLLFEKIDKKLNAPRRSNKAFWDVKTEWEDISALTLKSSTIRAKINALKVVKSYIKDDTLLEEITRPVVHDILEDIYFKKNLSHSYMGIIKSAISNIFEYAISKGYIEENPTKNISITKKKESIEERSKKREKYLEIPELKKVIQLANEVDTRWGYLIEFMSLTGLRQGEVFGLQTKNVKHGKIEILGTYDRYDKEKVTPKNRYSERTVLLSDRAYKIIQILMSENIKTNRTRNLPDDYIFVNRSGNPIYDSAFNKLLRSLNFKKNLSSHIFRHTHIAILTELGIPLKAIMDRVGHNEPKTTLSVYSHVTQKLSENVINKLNTVDLKRGKKEARFSKSSGIYGNFRKFKTSKTLLK